MATPTPAPHDVVIVGGARTPLGRLNGQLASFTAVDLGVGGLSERDVDQLTRLLGKLRHSSGDFTA